MTTFTASQDLDTTRKVEAYVRWCSRYFDDLPLGVQASLERDVREIVLEITTELNGDPADLVGSPDRFIAELRSAADLPPRAVADDPAAPSASPAPPARPVAARVASPPATAPISLGRGLRRIAGVVMLVLGFMLALALCGAEPDSSYVEPGVGGPEEVLLSIDRGVSLVVLDLDTGEVVWETTTQGDHVAGLLKSNPAESVNGFRFDFQTHTFETSGRVPSWDALVATIETYAEEL